MRSLLKCPLFLLTPNMLRWSFLPLRSSWPPCHASTVCTCVSELCAVTSACVSISVLSSRSRLYCLWFPVSCASGAGGDGFVLSFDFLHKCHHQLYERIIFIDQFGGNEHLYTIYFQPTTRVYSLTSSIKLLHLFCCEVVYLLSDSLQRLWWFLKIPTG